jgi:uncharacterized RDD family membrane protein YckC
LSDESYCTATAGLLRRLGALGYDCLLVAAVLIGAGGLFFAVAVPAAGLTGTITSDSPLYHPFQIYLLTVLIIFFRTFWRRGFTPGMRTWRLRIISIDGSPVNTAQCLTRLGVATLSLAAGGLGYWWVFINSEALTWHDIASKTRIVLDPHLS